MTKINNYFIQLSIVLALAHAVDAFASSHQPTAANGFLSADAKPFVPGRSAFLPAVRLPSLPAVHLPALPAGYVPAPFPVGRGAAPISIPGVRIGPSAVVPHESALPHEDVHGVERLSYCDLNTMRVEHRGKCNITDIHTEILNRGSHYHSQNQTAPVLIGIAQMTDEHGNVISRKPVQRIMAGQLWMGFLKDPQFGVHAVGKALAFLAGKDVTIFGMIPQEAIKNKDHKSGPAMLGFWLEIGDDRLNLQRASVAFHRQGILYADDPEKHIRLLEILDKRRAEGNSGLPESAMAFEAARKPSNRCIPGQKVDVWEYKSTTALTIGSAGRNITPGNMEFQPFVTRWDASTEPADPCAPAAVGEEKVPDAVAEEIAAAEVTGPQPSIPSLRQLGPSGVPLDLVREVIATILRTRTFTSGYIGLGCSTLQAEQAESFNLPQGTTAAVVRDFAQQGPAARAGIRPGDVIVKVEGSDIKTKDDLQNIIALMQEGRRTTLTFYRGGTVMTTELVVGAKPATTLLPIGGEIRLTPSSEKQTDLLFPWEIPNPLDSLVAALVNGSEDE